MLNIYAIVLWSGFYQNTGAGPQAGCDIPIVGDAHAFLQENLKGHPQRAGSGMPPQRGLLSAELPAVVGSGSALSHGTGIVMDLDQDFGVSPGLWESLVGGWKSCKLEKRNSSLNTDRLLSNSPSEEYERAVTHSSENYLLSQGGAVRNVPQLGENTA